METDDLRCVVACANNGRCCKFLAQSLVVEEHAQHIGQFVGIARCDQQAVDTVGDDFRRTSGGGGDHRKSGGHSLDHDLPERLGCDGGVNENVELGELGTDVVNEAHEGDAISDPQVDGERLQGLGIVALAEHCRADDSY